MLLYSFLGIIWVIPNFHPISANPGYGPPDPPDPPREPRYQGLRRSRKRYSPKSCSPGVEAVEPILPIPYAPWCWNIYLQNWVIFGVNVGKYSIHGAYGNDEFGYWLLFFYNWPLSQKDLLTYNMCNHVYFGPWNTSLSTGRQYAILEPSTLQ